MSQLSPKLTLAKGALDVVLDSLDIDNLEFANTTESQEWLKELNDNYKMFKMAYLHFQENESNPSSLSIAKVEMIAYTRKVLKIRGKVSEFVDRLNQGNNTAQLFSKSTPFLGSSGDFLSKYSKYTGNSSQLHPRQNVSVNTPPNVRITSMNTQENNITPMSISSKAASLNLSQNLGKNGTLNKLNSRKNQESVQDKLPSSSLTPVSTLRTYNMAKSIGSLGSPTLQNELDNSANLLEQTKKLLKNSGSTQDNVCNRKSNVIAKGLNIKPSELAKTEQNNNSTSSNDFLAVIDARSTPSAPKATTKKIVLPVKRVSVNTATTQPEPKRKNPTRATSATNKNVPTSTEHKEPIKKTLSVTNDPKCKSTPPTKPKLSQDSSKNVEKSNLMIETKPKSTSVDKKKKVNPLKVEKMKTPNSREKMNSNLTTETKPKSTSVDKKTTVDPLKTEKMKTPNSREVGNNNSPKLNNSRVKHQSTPNPRTPSDNRKVSDIRPKEAQFLNLEKHEENQLTTKQGNHFSEQVTITASDPPITMSMPLIQSNSTFKLNSEAPAAVSNVIQNHKKLNTIICLD